MKSATAAKKVSAPSLLKRVEALLIELDEALDDLAAERKALTAQCGPADREGAAIPQSTFRQIMDQRGFGDCLCRSYLAAMKEESK
jgi:hypothetical protein